MPTNSFRSCYLWISLPAIVLAALLLGPPSAPTASVIGAQREDLSKEHADADHGKREAVLRKAMSGAVDVFVDITQVETDKPMLLNARFVDLVDVTGKDLLHFSDPKGNQWLIDPDTVLTFRIRSK